jgi:penicillin-binding protein 1A
VQGASTIPQQFVKGALATQTKRTVFEKLREAALAYHLTRKWSKTKILTEYLNSIYFGNGPTASSRRRASTSPRTSTAAGRRGSRTALPSSSRPRRRSSRA